MNRADQLREALLSCLKCELLKQTEFVVIDNASTDNTADVVREVLDNSGYSYYYEKLAENIGVGGGRNYAYGKTSGDFVYVLDDDAVIDYENTPHFFKYAIEIFVKHSNIATLTTQIYDTAWKKNRLETGKKKISNDLFKCQMFCGGSHFLRKSFFDAITFKTSSSVISFEVKRCDSNRICIFCTADLGIPNSNKILKFDCTNSFSIISAT